MPGRGQVVALWLVALLALGGAGAAIFLGQQGTKVETVTPAELDAAVGALDTSVQARISALTAAGAGDTPVVNAAKLDGQTREELFGSGAPTTGHVNCQGIGMWPWASTTNYTQTKAGREVTKGEGFFDCLLFLPDGATITAFRGLVHDGSPTQQAVCYLIAAPINFDVSGTNPAYTPESGDTAQPGNIVLEDTTIEPATVDNDNFSYLAECWLSGPGNLALKGVSVEYTTASR